MFKNLFNLKKENFSEEKVHALFKLVINNQRNKQTHPLMINGHRSNTSEIYLSFSSGFGGTGVSTTKIDPYTGENGLGNYAGTYRNFKEIETYFNNLQADETLSCGGRCNMKKGEYTTVKHKENTDELLYPDGILNKLRRDYNNLVRNGKIEGPEISLPTAAPTTRAPTTRAPTTRAPTTAAPTTTESTKKATSGKSTNKTGIVIGVVVSIIILIGILMYLQKKGIINIPFLRKFNTRN